MDETEFIGKIKLYDHIIVYGAGMVGSLVCKWLKVMSFHNRMTGFAVSKKGREQLYCGEPVFGIEELLPYRESALVIIATMPELQKEIADRLSEYRFQNAVPIDQMLYHGMEQRYMLEFASRHPVRQKKIDLLFMASDNNSSSGAFLCMADLCVELRKYGMSSLVILPEYGNGEPVLEKREIEYTYIASEHWACLRKKPERREKEAALAGNKEAIEKIAHLIEKYQVKIVHNNTTYTYVGAVAAHRMDIPVVWHLRENIRIQGFDFADPERAMGLINQSDRILAVSKYIKTCMDKLDSDRVQVVYDGVSIENYYINRPVLKNTFPFVITMVGAVAEHKGQRELIEAAKVLKQRGYRDFVIRFIGKGKNEDLTALEGLVKEYRLEEYVSFLGRQEEIREFYAQTDVAVVCSEAEPFGRVTVEAQLAGCLVIGADTGATPELIQDGRTGMLYRRGDYSALADKIAYVMENPEPAAVIALAGQEHAYDTYTKERNAMEIAGIYEEVLRDRERQRKSLTDLEP